jgi:hypothetical protein
MTDESGSRAVAMYFEGTKRGEWHLDVVNPKGLGEKIGEHVLRAFMPCFVGVDRVVSLNQVFWRTMEELKGPENAHALGRDSWVLVMLIAGTMYELGTALDRLANEELSIAGARSRVRTCCSWGDIDGIRKRWSTGNALASMVRNEIAHHLGNPETYEKGLRLARTNVRAPMKALERCSDSGLGRSPESTRSSSTKWAMT